MFGFIIIFYRGYQIRTTKRSHNPQMRNQSKKYLESNSRMVNPKRYHIEEHGKDPTLKKPRPHILYKVQGLLFPLPIDL